MRTSILKTIELIALTILYVSGICANEAHRPHANISNEPSPNQATENNIVQNKEIIELKTQSIYNENEEDNKNAHGKKLTNYRFIYYISTGEVKRKLKKPNIIEHIKSNGNELIFDDFAKPPNDREWKVIEIFTCLHKYPILVKIEMSGDKDQMYHYMYDLNPDTGAFKNFTVEIKGTKQETDGNEVKYYIIDRFAAHTAIQIDIDEKWTEWFGELCKNHTQSNASIKRPPLEIAVELVEMPEEPQEQTGNKRIVDQSQSNQGDVSSDKPSCLERLKNWFGQCFGSSNSNS